MRITWEALVYQYLVMGCDVIAYEVTLTMKVLVKISLTNWLSVLDYLKTILTQTKSTYTLSNIFAKILFRKLINKFVCVTETYSFIY